MALSGSLEYKHSLSGTLQEPTSLSGELSLPIANEGNTTDYNALYNKPTINGTELKGDLTLEELGIIVNTIKDILINGATIVDKDGNANIPIADGATLGLVKPYVNGGVTINAKGQLFLPVAVESDYTNRNKNTRVVTCNNYDLAVKCAMTDGKGQAWTTEEKAMGRNRLGLDLEPVVIDIETAEDVRVIEIVEHDGKPLSEYAFTQMWVYAESVGGLTSTSNELQVRINNRNAMDTIPCLCAPTGFLINTTTQYWGGYLDTRNGIALSRTSATTYKHWRSDAQIQANMYELLFQKNINEVYLAGVITNIPKGTKFKIVLR